MLLAHDVDQGLRTRDIRTAQNITFDALLLSSNTSIGLRDSGFLRPSPIQLHGIPLGKCGFDLLLEAKSGTGKTAVFTIVALEKLDLQQGLQTVILAPTREIAAQICDVIKQIGSDFRALRVEVVMGGLPVQEDISKFKHKNVHIVVGSPGRLRHLIQEKYIDVSAVRLIVFDEADKLMEKSFQADINYIFAVLPIQKQVIMSSATYPEAVRTFINKYVQNAQHICPDSNSILLGIEQKVTTVKYNANIVKQTQHRFVELLKILTRKQFKQCLIFCNYQARVVGLHKMLKKEKWPAEQLYGQQDQTDRLDALKTLQEYKCRILISTDLAARGIDASNVDLVINFEPPFEWQTYLHRIGRAGRFGSYGIAVTIFSEGKEETKFKVILETLKVPLKDFWNEDNFSDGDLSSTLSSQLSETVHTEPKVDNSQFKEMYQKLEDLLISNIALENRNEIESFDGICNSFEESCIDSFQNDQDSNANMHEPNEMLELLKAKIMTAKECFNCTATERICKVNEINYEINGMNENSRIERNKSTTNLENHTNGNATGISNGALLETNTLYDHNLVNQMHDNENKTEYEFETPDTTEALRNAGLPTSFGKQINSKPSFKSHKNKNMKNRDHDYTDFSESKQRVNKNKRATSKDAQKHITESSKPKNYQIYQSDTDSSDTSECPIDNNESKYSRRFQYNINYDKNANGGNKYNYNIYNSDYTFKYKMYDQIDANKLRHNYNDWYNKLKLRTNQIELAIYIEEMSQL